MTNQVLTPQSDITIKYDPVYLPHFNRLYLLLCWFPFSCSLDGTFFLPTPPPHHLSVYAHFTLLPSESLDETKLLFSTINLSVSSSAFRHMIVLWFSF